MAVARTPTGTGESREARGRRGSSRPELEAMVENLERLRELVHRRFEQIELMAEEQSASLQTDTSDRERTLREKVANLEAMQSRLQAEFRRREQEWEETLAQVEEDRRLLTEAWERLEKEQAEAAPPAEFVARGQGASPRASTQGPVIRATPGPEHSENAVTQAILWEFQSLKSDVRRNAKSSSGR